MNREDTLKAAAEVVSNKRAEVYGDAHSTHKMVSILINEYIKHKSKLDATDIAILMIFIKISRAAYGVHHTDNFIDIAGYAALAGEFSERDRA